MSLYIAVAVVLFLFAIFQTDKNRNILLILGIILLFIISVWRNFSVGTDTLNYKLSFDSIENDARFLSFRSNEIVFPY